ncbi:MAG: hypothetical protein E5V89_08460 [Mesorhizobium sp.]|nr:MAG: hypothetical protein E5V89_08460 [Mesorhizobium sp.]
MQAVPVLGNLNPKQRETLGIGLVHAELYAAGRADADRRHADRVEIGPVPHALFLGDEGHGDRQGLGLRRGVSASVQAFRFGGRGEDQGQADDQGADRDDPQPFDPDRNALLPDTAHDAGEQKQDA